RRIHHRECDDASERRRYQRQLLHHLPPDGKSDQRRRIMDQWRSDGSWLGQCADDPRPFLRHRPCQRGHLLIRRSDPSSQRCMGARPASTSNRQSSRRLRQGLLQRSRTPHTHDDHQELHHRLRIELLGRPGRAIPHPSPLERAPEQFHLSREEHYYLRQRRCTQTHCCRQYLHRLQKRRTGPPGHRRHIQEGLYGRRLLQQRRHQLEWIRYEQLLGKQRRVFRHHSAQDTRLARLATHCEGNVRFASALCLAVALLAPIVSQGADRKESGRPWITTAAIIRDGGNPAIWSGLIITAAHLTALNASMDARVAGVVLPGKLLKQA